MESASPTSPGTGPSPPRSVFFYPSRPNPGMMLEQLRRVAGWELASSPESADWCVLYQDATWVTLPDDAPWKDVAATWINGRCRDISKRRVEQVFEAVFGYPLAIDPLTHQGHCLRKSNKNYVKDAVVLQCPLPVGDVRERYVHERLVDGRVPGLGIIELRTTVVGREVVSVSRKVIPDWIRTGRFIREILDFGLVYPSSVFSRQELKQIVVFCAAMGLDFGALDIMRDNEDQRIYILDANKTPSYGGPSSQYDTMACRVRIEQVAQAFLAHFPPRSAAPASMPSVAPPPETSERDDGVRSIAAQAERLARLEAAVGTLSAEIAQVLAANCAASRSGKKKRKA